MSLKLRGDPLVPIEETVRAFNFVIEQGWVSDLGVEGRPLLKCAKHQAFYWATSEWSAQEIEEAHRTLISSPILSPGVTQCMLCAP